jgi:hypothetical protein
MIARFICHLFGHRRSSRHARVIDGRWRSTCKRCGAILVRMGAGNWQVLEQER